MPKFTIAATHQATFVTTWTIEAGDEAAAREAAEEQLERWPPEPEREIDKGLSRLFKSWVTRTLYVDPQSADIVVERSPK